MHQNLGFAKFETLFLILKIQSDGSFALETSAAITGILGPLPPAWSAWASTTVLSFSDGADAALGPLDLALKFKPPNRRRTRARCRRRVKGGGYLYLDSDKGEYAGALELVFAGFLTRSRRSASSPPACPTGRRASRCSSSSPPSSARRSSSASASRSSAVGGLLGLNRTCMLEALAAGVRTGAIESVMFPQRHHRQRAADHQRPARVLPAAAGHVPDRADGQARLGHADAGHGLDRRHRRDPAGNIAILGVLKVALPDEDAALLVLQVNFIGALESDKKRLWFFAVAVRLAASCSSPSTARWACSSPGATTPNFVLSVGGFHPRSRRRRCPSRARSASSICILNESFAAHPGRGLLRRHLEHRAVRRAGRALLRRRASSRSRAISASTRCSSSRPSTSSSSFSASMSVKVFGIGRLQRPLPRRRWKARRRGTSRARARSRSFLRHRRPVFDTRGARRRHRAAAPSRSLPILVKPSSAKRENWSPAASRATTARRLRAIERDGGAGAASRRRAAGQPAARCRSTSTSRSRQPSRSATFEQLDVKVAARAWSRTRRRQEQFATAQFRDLTAPTKLSAPGFEQEDAGVDMSVAGRRAHQPRGQAVALTS